MAHKAHYFVHEETKSHLSLVNTAVQWEPLNNGHIGTGHFVSIIERLSSFRGKNVLPLKPIHIHLSPGSTCGLVAYALHILAQRYTFFMGCTAIFDW